MKSIIAPSILSADFNILGEQIAIVEQAGAKWLHLDIMDGAFVPNFGLGVDYIRSLRELTKIPLDIHLMVRDPEYKLQWIGIQKDDIVSIHYESTFQVQRALDWLEPFGCKKFLAINPATPIYAIEEVLDYIDGVNLLMVNPGFAGQKIVESTLKKAAKLQQFLEQHCKADLIFEADGNITLEHAKQLRAIGADMFVAGTSSVFMGKVEEYRDNIKKLKAVIQ